MVGSQKVSLDMIPNGTVTIFCDGLCMKDAIKMCGKNQGAVKKSHLITNNRPLSG